MAVPGPPLQDKEGMGGMMVRGPPPYHSSCGDQWPPGMGAQLRGPMDVQDPMYPSRTPPSPAPVSQATRCSGCQVWGMQGMPMEFHECHAEALRPVAGLRLPSRGLALWSTACVPYPGGQGEAERFMTPRVREELRHQRGRSGRWACSCLWGRSSGMGQGMEVERMMQGGHWEDGSSHVPGKMAGVLGSWYPMGMEFAGGRGLLSPPWGKPGLVGINHMGPGQTWAI